jgi:hypothetical protein
MCLLWSTNWGFISQKTAFFIVTAVKTSNLTYQRFLHFGFSWQWVVTFMLLPLYPRRKSPRYLFDKRLGGPQNRSGRCREDKILDPTETGTLSHPSVVQPVASRYTYWLPFKQAQEHHDIPAKPFYAHDLCNWKEVVTYHYPISILFSSPFT